MTQSQRRIPNYRRRFGWFGAFIALLFGGYSAGWFYLGGMLETKAADALRAFNSNGREVECVNAEAHGFPFRMGLWCDALHFADTRQGVAVTAANFRSAAQVYNPFHIVAELDSPATIDLPALGAVDAGWDNLRASVRADYDFPERVSLEMRGLKAKLENADAALDIQTGEFHMRRNGADLDLAANMTGAAPQGGMLRTAAVPPIDGMIDLTIKDGVALARRGGGSLRGVSGTLRMLTISSGADAALSVSGPFAVNEQGMLDAKFMLSVKNPQAIGAILQRVFPHASEQIAAAAMGVAAMGPDASIPLIVKDGRAQLGFIPLGPVPAM